MSSRRNFLSALGLGAGAAVLSPLLRSVSASEPSGAPRFVFVLEGNGVNPGNLLSDATRAALVGAGASIEAGDRVINRSYAHDSLVEVPDSGLSSALALGSLAGTAELESLEEHALVTLGLSSKVSGGGHTGNYGALSCSPSRPRLPSAATIDHVMGSLSQVRGATPFDVVRLGIHAEDNLNYNTCAAGPSRPAPIVCDPATAFYSLFGSVAPGQGPQFFKDRRDLLDFMRADGDAALGAFSSSSLERAKVEAYLASIETLTERHRTIEGMSAQLQTVVPAGPGVSALYESTHNLDKLEAMFDLATAALIGCLTNVVVIGSGTGERGYNLGYTSLGLEEPSRHAICHAYQHDTLTTVTERHVSLVSRLARALMAVPEGNGSMLDNTVIVFGSDNGEKHHSNAEEWPLLVVGGKNAGLNLGGRSLVYPGSGQENNRQLSNFWSTLLDLAGQPNDEFGIDERRVAAGVLSELVSG